MTAPGFTGENILIVDDMSENLKLLKDMLNNAGYSARPLLNGEAALRAVEKSPPDLVLLDIMMPGLSGYDVCQRLKADPRARDIPVIFLSALNDPEAIAKGFAVGGVDYITKPFRAEEVLARVQTHLNLRRAREDVMDRNRRLQREMAERREIENALHDSEEQFRCMFELHSAVMLLIDPATATIVNANQAATRYYGYPLEELMGMSVNQINLLPPDEIQRLLSDAREKGRNRFEFRHRLADGRIRDVEVRSTPIPFKSRNLLFSIISDITERKVAEQRLVAANQFLDQIINALPSPVFIKDENHRWLMLNDAYCQLMGHDRESLIGKSDHDFFPREQADVFWEKDNRVFSDGQTVTNEERFTDAAGEVHTILTKKTLMKNANGEKILIGIITDISERKRAEDALREAKAAAESHSRAKSEFLANMSHEIRTPMNSVLGFLSIVIEDADLSEKHRRFLGTAHKASKSLLVLINDILDIGKLESGSLDLASASLDLGGLMRETLSGLSVPATEKGLYMHSTIDDAVPRRMSGDAKRIKSILTHLVGNAIKFTERGGVDIAVRPAEDKRFLHFTIRDTGIGMSEECLGKVFQPFTQADASPSRRFGGTGLGAAISKQLVELMGGAIWAEAEEGKGSVFHFTIPLNRDAAARPLEADVRRPGAMPDPPPGKAMAPSDVQAGDDGANAGMDLDAERLRDIFQDLLVAFKEYSPDAAEPFLDPLSQLLGQAKTASIRQSIDRFDFSGARWATLEIARRMGIDLENQPTE